MFKHIITAHIQGSIQTKGIDNFIKNDTSMVKGKNHIKIIIEKEHVLENPEETYSFLTKCYNLFN